MNLVELVCTFQKGPITAEQAQAICDAIPSSSYTHETGMGRAVAENPSFLETLNREFPEFRFRIVLCHDRERTYWAVTFKDPDPREHGEMAKNGEWDDDGEYVPHRR